MTEEIKPALPKEEWEAVQEASYNVTGSLVLNYDARVHDGDSMRYIEQSRTLEGPALMAVANHRLPDSSPYKITRGHLDALREVLESAEAHLQDEGPPGAGWKSASLDRALDGCDALMNIIEALLPPEDA